MLDKANKLNSLGAISARSMNAISAAEKDCEVRSDLIIPASNRFQVPRPDLQFASLKGEIL